MQAVIYVEIANEMSFSYEKPILNFIKANYPHITLYDFDNHSDAMMIRYAIELLAQTDQVLIIIEAKESPANQLISFFEKLIQFPHMYKVLFNGSNMLAERMLGILAKDEGKVKKDLSFLKKQQEIQSFFE